MTNYQSTPRSNRSKGIVVKHLLQFALFVAFSLWLLYQITQPNSNSGSSVSQLTNEKISNFLGRKGSAGTLQSTPITLTLDDVTNPLEEGEIPRYSKGIEEVEFRIKAESFKEVNDNNTVLPVQDGRKSAKKSNISFSDVNGIPQDVRDKLIGTRVKTKTVIATHADKGRNGTIEES
uniref:S-antigen protein-like isoform X1 n=1 Tax=Tanacetum cinerariifolium TaxID=118510 RepID=A0A6L2JIR8_TANCI|nr:S-antigen protein-like isoform X1 [Tanacetum cinerariifolium]